MRLRGLCVMLLAGMVAAGCDSDCPTPTAPTSPSPQLTIASLTISGPSELQVGQTAQLTATARYSDGSTENVTNGATWVTNNVNICTITATGVLTSVSAGTCNITAVINNTTGTHTVVCFFPGNPTGNPPTGPPEGPPSGPGSGSLRIEGPSSVAVGSQIQLRAFRSDNNEEVTNQANWSGNNPGVATTSNEGRVNGQSVGSVDVTATFQDLAGSKNVQVTTDGNPPVNPPTCPGGPGCPPVSPPPTCPNPPCNPAPTVTGLAIQGITSVPVGGTSQLQAVASFSNGTSQTVTNESAWASGNSGVAPVNTTGFVTGAAQGTSPISATYQGVTASVNFTVTGGGGPPPTPTVNSLTVTGTSPLTVGQTSQYNAVANLSDGTNPNVNGQAQWSSSNPGVANVGSSGNVTAVSAGQTTITATYQGRSGSVPLTVNAAAPDLIGLELRVGVNVLTGNGPLGLNLNLADLINGNPIIDLKVFALYSDGSKNDVTSASVINSPLLAIDGQGTLQLVTLLLQGLLNPNHQINVTYGGYTANVNVTIQLPVLQTLGFPSNSISLHAGNQLPSLNALFSQGITSNIVATLPGISYALQPGGALAPLLGLPIVGPLLQQLLNTVQVVGGVLNLDGGLLGSLLSNPLLSGLGGVLPLNLVATLNGVSTAPITLLVIP